MCIHHFAMTSTYLPFFFPLEAAAPFRACGAPSKSSIELALLSDVAGREGGARPDPGPGGVEAAAPVETGRGMFAPAGGGTPREDDRAGLPERDGALPVGGRLSDPVTAAEAEAGPLEAIGGAPAALLVLPVLLCGAGPFGGGGVARAAALALFGSFLLTHFFRFVS